MGDTVECRWPRWDVADGVVSGETEQGKESAGFAGETDGVRVDGLAGYIAGELGGDDVGDIYIYGNVVPNSACEFGIAGLCCGTSIRLLDNEHRI